MPKTTARVITKVIISSINSVPPLSEEQKISMLFYPNLPPGKISRPPRCKGGVAILEYPPTPI
jgi:hypothetical protein